MLINVHDLLGHAQRTGDFALFLACQKGSDYLLLARRQRIIDMPAKPVAEAPQTNPLFRI
jgi:hypothetical protein